MIRFPIVLALSLLTAPVGDISSGDLQAATEMLRSRPAVAHLVINSPGGSVDDGWDFIDEMSKAQAAGTRIICSIPNRGMAASMAAVILQACDVRLMGRQSVILFHTASISRLPSSNQWDLWRWSSLVESENDRAAAFISGRLFIGLDEYRRKVKDRDWWLGWEEALEVGAIDGLAR